MAKKILAEEFSLNSYDLKLDDNNKLEFNSVVQADAAHITSIDNRVSTETSTRSANVTSIDLRVSTETKTREDAITSLDLRVSTESSVRTGNVESIDLRVSTDVSSIDDRLTDEEATTKILANQAVTMSASDQTVSLAGLGFDGDTDPVVVGMLRSTDANDPIVACMLSGTQDHANAVFLFSDEIPSNNYKLDVILTR